MSSGNATPNEGASLLEQLNTAESALRANLHAHGIDRTARAHLERALAHVREAHIAIHQPGHAKSVRQLVSDIMNVEHLFDRLRQQPPPRVVLRSRRV